MRAFSPDDSVEDGCFLDLRDFEVEPDDGFGVGCGEFSEVLLKEAWETLVDEEVSFVFEDCFVPALVEPALPEVREEDFAEAVDLLV